jgi:hypothetical protein
MFLLLLTNGGWRSLHINGGFSRRGSIDPLQPFYSNEIAPDKSSRVSVD